MFTVYSREHGFVLTRHMSKSDVLWLVVVVTGPQLMQQNNRPPDTCVPVKNTAHTHSDLSHCKGT